MRITQAYIFDGAWPSEEPDNWAAIRGTALHAHLEDILAEPGVLTEVTTSYRGIPGHADLVRTGKADGVPVVIVRGVAFGGDGTVKRVAGRGSADHPQRCAESTIGGAQCVTVHR